MLFMKVAGTLSPLGDNTNTTLTKEVHVPPEYQAFLTILFFQVSRAPSYTQQPTYQHRSYTAQDICLIMIAQLTPAQGVHRLSRQLTKLAQLVNCDQRQAKQCIYMTQDAESNADQPNQHSREEMPVAAQDGAGTVVLGLS